MKQPLKQRQIFETKAETKPLKHETRFSRVVSSASRYFYGVYVEFETKKHYSAHTPPHPPGWRVAKKPARRVETVCVRYFSFMVPSGRKIHKNGAGNSHGNRMSLFWLSGFSRVFRKCEPDAGFGKSTRHRATSRECRVNRKGDARL